MGTTTLSELPAADALTGTELVEVSQLSATVTITAATISALASDNSFNDSASGFVTAGFAVGDRVKVEGFTGDTANNVITGKVTALTAGKMTIGGTDGDVLVDDAEGESVTISKWTTKRASLTDVVALAAAGSPLTQGKRMVPWLASAMTPRTTNGAATGTTESTTNKIMLETLDFDQSTDEFAQFRLPMPKSWNEGTFTAKFRWTAGATGNVVWGIQAVALSDDDAVDTAFGTAQTVTDGVTAAGDVMVSAETSAVTIAGTPAEGDVVIFQVYRDADNGSDTLAADAKLMSVEIYISLNAGNDA